MIKANHEFQADNFVLKYGVSYQDYSNKLLKYTIPKEIMSIVSGFNNLLIKKRLIMMSKSPYQREPFNYRFLLLIPVVSLLFLITAFRSVSISEPSLNEIENGLYETGILYATPSCGLAKKI